MPKIAIGITGQAGFVGTNLYNYLGLFPAEFERIPFEDSFFSHETDLDRFVSRCDVIVHLAAVNRCENPQELYDTNIALVQTLIAAIKKSGKKIHVLFSSSTQEEMDNLYGKSKREGRELFKKWAKECGSSFIGLIVPNVFGQFCRPNYNSFIATFAHKLTHSEMPTVITDSTVKLIYVDSLCSHIMEKIKRVHATGNPVIEDDAVLWDIEEKVSSILMLFTRFRDEYFTKGIIPVLNNKHEVHLFNTFRSYIDLNGYFPFRLMQNADERGTFVETIRLGIGGQVSFSTTKPGVTRGNHFHTRKIERFTIIRGKARIQLRKIGSDCVYNFELSGESPSYVDIPVWFAHNITNTGTGDLYTQFWINEWYESSEPDTFFEAVE